MSLSKRAYWDEWDKLEFLARQRLKRLNKTHVGKYKKPIIELTNIREEVLVAYLPTEEEIAIATAEIRATWSEEELERRKAIKPSVLELQPTTIDVGVYHGD